MPTTQQLITHLSQQLGLVPTTLAQHQANMNALQQLAELVAKLEKASEVKPE